MTQRHDPDIDNFRLELTQNSPKGPLPSVEQLRQDFAAVHDNIPLPPGCAVDPIWIGDLNGELIKPPGADATRALIYFHGGGHMFGSARTHRHLVARLAQAANCIAYSFDYRLAPENPFPAGLDDAARAYYWVLSQGLTANRIVIGGESAGGNLCAALLLRCRAEQKPLPAGAYLLSPWLDMTFAGESHATKSASDPLITTASLAGCAQAYLRGHAANDPLVSPIFADLAGLPPLLIQVGSEEVLLSDSLVFAQRAALASVDVRLESWPEMIHAWPLFHFALSAGLRAIDVAGAWIKQQQR